MYAHLPDSTAAREQEALGILGVNLVHGAFHRRNPAVLFWEMLMVFFQIKHYQNGSD